MKKGNQNAKKDNPKTERIYLRCTKEEKEIIKSNAASNDMSLNEFIIDRSVKN